MEQLITHREEDIIRGWLESTDDIFDRIVLAKHIQPIVDKFKERFSYSGLIYRGIRNDDSRELSDIIVDMPLASYTPYVELASEFRGWSEMSSIIEMEVENAFNLTEFLHFLLSEHLFYSFSNCSLVRDRVVIETEVLYHFDKSFLEKYKIDETEVEV